MTDKPCPTKGCVGLHGHPGACASLGVFVVEVVEWAARKAWRKLRGSK